MGGPTRGYVGRNWTLQQRLDHYADKAGGPNACWLWAGSIWRRYGRLSWNGRIAVAHRLAWEAVHGPISDGLHVCHRCDTPACVNPGHLFLGTHRDNMRDMYTKGRRAPATGERNGASTISDTVVRAIREASGLQREIGATFGVSQPHVSAIRRGQRREAA